MDREHPIPQEVSTYEFRLVGDMTIKQFMQVASGALISLLLYSTNIAPYVKWPLILISFLSGIALAFFPIQDRPLSKWIILFVKAIYSPTLYIWDKNASLHEFFQPEETDITEVNPLPDLPAAPTINQQLVTDSSGTVIPDLEETKLDQSEEAFLEKLNTQFSDSNTSNTATISSVNTPQPLQNIPPSASQTQQTPAEPNNIQSTNNTSDEANNDSSKVGEEITPIANTQGDINAKAAIFAPDAAPPSPPTRPNVVVGQIVDSDGKLLSGAILEIIDANGRSVRALRSNNLGHFMIVTPLSNGNYKITVEKEGYEFEPVSFEAIDRIIPPIAIWAKNKSVNENQPDTSGQTLKPQKEEEDWVTKVKESLLDLPKQDNNAPMESNIDQPKTENAQVSGNLYDAADNNQGK